MRNILNIENTILTKMKILGTDNFVSERIKVQPITNAELDSVQKEFQKSKMNPFGLTRKDLIGFIEHFPMGIVVRMIEETQMQRDYLSQKEILMRLQSAITSAFSWQDTKAGDIFWQSVIRHNNYDLFFEKYPEYKEYNIG